MQIMTRCATEADSLRGKLPQEDSGYGMAVLARAGMLGCFLAMAVVMWVLLWVVKHVTQGCGMSGREIPK